MKYPWLDNSSEPANLPQAPIVEAVIHWQVPARIDWNLEEIKSRIHESLPEYKKIEDIRNVGFKFSSSLKANHADTTVEQTDEWIGIRLTHSSQPYVAQFLRGELIFSRLKPYESWNIFVPEAIRVWKVFSLLIETKKILNLGVRFINRIQNVNSNHLGKILKEPPTHTQEFPLQKFFYQSTFSIPGHPLAFQVIKTIAESTSLNIKNADLILDILTHHNETITTNDDELIPILRRLRNLKNKVFRDLLTPEAIQSFGGEQHDH